MYKLKYLILIFFMITISFLLCAAVPPSKKIEHNFDLYINIPKQHKIKILILGKGSVFIDNEEKHTGDIINCKRFSSLSFSIKPANNYTIDKIHFNDNEITSNLSSNTITLSNISNDGTLTIQFKPNPSDNSKSPSEGIKEIPNNINNNLIRYINEAANIISYIKTGDNYILFIFIPLITCSIYIIYFVLKKLKA